MERRCEYQNREDRQTRNDYRSDEGHANLLVVRWVLDVSEVQHTGPPPPIESASAVSAMMITAKTS
jgi:hypothetical protein